MALAVVQTAPSVVDVGHCISKDPRELAPLEALAVCDGRPTHVSRSVYCPPECGGHLICDPCYRLALRRGLAVEE